MVRTLVKKGTAWLLLGLLFCQTMIFGVRPSRRHATRFTMWCCLLP